MLYSSFTISQPGVNLSSLFYSDFHKILYIAQAYGPSECKYVISLFLMAELMTSNNGGLPNYIV